MSLQYLDEYQPDMMAIRGLGSAFSDSVIRMAQAKAQQAELARRLQIESAAQQAQAGRLQVENQLTAAQTDSAKFALQQGQRIGRLRSLQNIGGQGVMQMVNDPTSGPQMMDDLRSANVVPQGQFQVSGDELLKRISAAIGGQVYGTAASDPATAYHLTQPQLSSPGQTARSPVTGETMYTNPLLMSPYQEGRLDLLGQNYTNKDTNSKNFLAERRRHNGEMERLTNLRYDETARHDKVNETKTKNTKTSSFGDYFSTKFGGQTNTAAPDLSQVPDGNVAVVAPDGTVGHIPQGNVQKALAQGYKLISQ